MDHMAMMNNGNVDSE